MKTLISTLFAGLFILAVASAVNAGSANEYFTANALDSSGLAVVAPHSPSMPWTISAADTSDTSYLDSNKLSPVSEVKHVRPAIAKGTEKPILYCFDSGGMFCARKSDRSHVVL